MPTLNTGRERSLSWAFEKPGQETNQIMNLLNLPMKNSVTLKKMAKTEATSAAKQSQSIKQKVHDALPSFQQEKKANVEEGQDGGNMTKQSHKRNAFSGFSSQEKAVYSFVVKGSEESDMRPLSALDEILQSLRYAAHFLDLKEAKHDVEMPPMVTASFDSLTSRERVSSFGFCISIFLEFLFQGKVCVNGKDCRAYSSLRVELQNILIKSNDVFQVEVTAGGDAEGQGNGKSKRAAGSTSTRKHTALELAELLCSQYMSQPATRVDFGEDTEIDEEDAGRVGKASMCRVCIILKYFCYRPFKRMVWLILFGFNLIDLVWFGLWFVAWRFVTGANTSESRSDHVNLYG